VGGQLKLFAVTGQSPQKWKVKMKQKSFK